MKSQSFHFGTSHRSSDSIDFNDVFGGPPRRFSPREVGPRRNFDEDSKDERSLMPTRSLKEKSVFGEVSNSKRHNLGEDFFSDIYRGDESFSSPRSFREGDGGSSRFMSPARISNPKPESSSSSYPRKFSVPAKLDEGNEVPGFSNRWGDGGTSGISSPSSSSRFQNRIFQGNEDDKSLFHQEHLSRESSLRYKSLAYSATPDRKGNSGRMRNDARIVDADIDFHFSFYKWAGNGVPVVTLLPIPDTSGLKSRRDATAVGAHREALDEVYNSKMWEDNVETKEIITTAAKEMAPDEENDVRVDKFGTKGKRGVLETFSQSTYSREMANVLRESQDIKTEAFTSRKSRSTASTNVPEERWGASLHYDADHKPCDSPKVSENQECKQEEKHFMAFSSGVHQPDSVTSPERDIDPFEVNFMVEVLTDDPENFTPPQKDENTQDIDAKIRNWSDGKKGNIQSLLSTLQFVLWPRSGWKPVPLVNLLEPNSVKRAYQKAMLHLHPDKLQQRNAAFHQKYLADKVFEILQEAWDHFNTLSHV